MITYQVMTLPQLYKTMLVHRTHIVLFRDGGNVRYVSELSLDKMPWKGKALGGMRPMSTEMPQIDYDAQLYRAIEKIQTEGTGILAVMRKNRLVGVLLGQHAEFVISLYLSHKKALEKRQG